MRRVLGVDPGTHRIGWAIVEGTASKQIAVSYGCIESDPGTAASSYLVKIAKELEVIILDTKPDLLGLETILFQKNIKTAISVAEARGVILLTAGKNNLEVVDLAPNTIKLAVAGSGSADKKDIERMVGLLLGLDTKRLLDDTTDALASAIATLVTYK